MTRPELWIHFFNGFLSINRHFNVDLTNPSNLRTLFGIINSAIHSKNGSFPPTVARNRRNRASSSPRFLQQSRIQPTHRLGAVKRDCTLPSSSAENRFSGKRVDRNFQRKERRTMGYAIRCLPGAIQAVICAWSMNSRNSGSCIISEAGTVAR